jgi:hypothetical protein
VVISTGRTVHVVPGERGTWNVVDFDRHGSSFPTKAAALNRAKSIAAANQPSQVVLFDAFGHMEPIAHYQLPVYPLPEFSGQNGASLFEATMKALLIGGFAAAGIAVLGELVDRVERDARKQSAKSSPKGSRRPRKS